MKEMCYDTNKNYNKEWNKMMTIREAIKKYLSIHNEYTIIEEYEPQCMIDGDVKCLAVELSAEQSYMQFIMELTEYFDSNNIEDTELELEGVSVEAVGDRSIVFFPQVK